MAIMSDATLLKVTDNIRSNLSRPDYEQFLVELGLYSLDELRDKEHGEYASLSKREFIIRTLQESDELRFLEALNDRITFRVSTRRALALDGIQFGRTVAGHLAEPAKERNRLEIALAHHNLNQVQTFLDQSWDNYVQGNFEAANAMTRTALEHLVELIASQISSAMGNEGIPQQGRYIGPADYRNYLRVAGFLDKSEKGFLDSFYGYASTGGSHPGVSSEADARLRRFVAVGIALLFVEKLNNTSFMSGLI